MVESLKEVSGYLGDNVTLPSEAGASWNLSKIEWSILTNNTWIATYRNGRENIERFHQYKGRLSLNTTTGKKTNLWLQNVSVNERYLNFSLYSVSSMFFFSIGDLMIHNLSRKDAMDYSVDLENAEGQNRANKIKLTVTGKSH